MNTQSELLTAAMLCVIVVLNERYKALKNIRKPQRKRLWARKWLQRRNEGKGVSNMVFKELRVEDPASFKNFSRMSAKTFDILLQKIEPFIKREDTIFRESISSRTRLLVTLRYLATGESFQSLSYYFRISVPSLSLLIPETTEAIYNTLKKEYLKTPTTEQEWLVIAKRFWTQWNFPNCLGALDGKHIAFRARKCDGSLYYNYKGFHSIVLMALVDADYNFLYVDVGCNGRISDGGVFSNSTLCTAIQKNTLNFPQATTFPQSAKSAPFVIVADDAFRLSTHIMKPWGQRSNTMAKIFNYRLSRARRVVENAFGILANRFQVLQKEIKLSVDKVQQITLTCCLLHNFIKAKDGKIFYLHGVDVENVNTVSFMEGEWRSSVCLTSLGACNVNRSADEPIQIRQTFTDYFNNEGFVSWQWEAIKKFNF
ncbi:putative nuclease HARBI1 [Tenebrio molitor]|jgi:hypothetical protein|uniref:putative nuclease HARBI1 n=1 Tax=Tenebrio molitor TaxID=7067 RepID=UPI0036247C5F